MEVYTKQQEEQNNKATTTNILEQAHNSYFTKTVTPSVRLCACKTLALSLLLTLSASVWTFESFHSIMLYGKQKYICKYVYTYLYV